MSRFPRARHALDQADQLVRALRELSAVRQERDEALEQRDTARRWAVSLEQELAAVTAERDDLALTVEQDRG